MGTAHKSSIVLKHFGDNDKAAQMSIQTICHSVHCFFEDIAPHQSFILFSSLPAGIFLLFFENMSNCGNWNDKKKMKQSFGNDFFVISDD